MCCKADSYCYKLCIPNEGQKDRDKYLHGSRVALIASAILFLTSIVFCSLMLNHTRPLKIYAPLFATSLSLSIFPLIIRFCCFEPPKPPPESDSDIDSDSVSSSDYSSDSSSSSDVNEDDNV